MPSGNRLSGYSATYILITILVRAGELIQYNYIIHTALQTFTWENVYCYDREFRMHMSRYHLVRSWSVILQQAWSMCLKDKLQGTTPNNSYSGNGNTPVNKGGTRCRLCFDYNSGSLYVREEM